MLTKIQDCSITCHFFIVSARGISCKFCGKKFNRGFNLRRHEQEYCPQKDPERDMSETESHAMDSEDDACSTYESESPITTDDEMETEGGEKDHWMPMVDEAMKQHETAFEEMKKNLIDSGLDEQSDGEKAYSNIFLSSKRN